MAITWSDTPYGATPDMNTGEVGGYAQAPQDWGFLPQLATQLGMPSSMLDLSGGMTAQGDAIPNNSVQNAVDWLQNQGYTPKTGSQGSTYYNGIFDKNGNLVASQGLDSSKAALGDLLGLVTTVGLPALGGAALSGSLGDLGIGSLLGNAGDTSGLAAANAASDQAMIDLANSGTALGTGTLTVPSTFNSALDSQLYNQMAGIGGGQAAATAVAPNAVDLGSLGGITPTGVNVPSVFNAAQDSQLANQQLGITGDQAAAAATAPSGVNLTNAGGEMATGIGNFTPLLSPTAPTGITPAQLQQGINAAKQLVGSGGGVPTGAGNNSGLASLLNSIPAQNMYSENAVTMGNVNPFNVRSMDLATTPIDNSAGTQSQPVNLNQTMGWLKLLGIVQ